MSETRMKVALVVDVQGLENRPLFEKHLKREGFLPIEGEEFAYLGEATSHIFNTRAYILEVVSKGLKKTTFETCRIIFEIGENPMELYIFDKTRHEFVPQQV
ncbi:hypothetical protein [Sulfurospirillum sp. 1612]|uniref:hypothetical protein n=1 Tax=Sulfurospirillum sp. 1612 TaxID=3094835 RepID=UPI002F93F33C